MFGGAVFLGQYFQIGRGYSPTEAGLLTIPMMAGVLGSSIVAGRLITKTGKIKPYIVAGSIVLVARVRPARHHRPRDVARPGRRRHVHRRRRRRHDHAEPRPRRAEHRLAQGHRRGQLQRRVLPVPRRHHRRLGSRRRPRPPGQRPDHRTTSPPPGSPPPAARVAAATSTSPPCPSRSRTSSGPRTATPPATSSSSPPPSGSSASSPRSCSSRSPCGPASTCRTPPRRRPSPPTRSTALPPSTRCASTPRTTDRPPDADVGPSDPGPPPSEDGGGPGLSSQDRYERTSPNRGVCGYRGAASGAAGGTRPASRRTAPGST